MKGPLLALLFSAMVAPASAQWVFSDATGERVRQERADLPWAEKEVELGDFDRDGDLDVAIAIAGPSLGGRLNRLYRNDGGTLVDVTGSPLIAGFERPDVSRASFLRDYDGDGWLDLVVVNDSIAPGRSGETVYLAGRAIDGVFSHFEDQSERLRGAGGPSCGAASADLDGDGDFDLYLGNYPAPAQDTLYFNDGGGFFVDATAGSLPPDGDYTSDVSTADLDGNGLTDVLVGNHFDDNQAYLNGFGGEEPGRLSGAVVTLSSGPALQSALEPGDFDLDGRVDVYVSNHTDAADRVLHHHGLGADGRPQFGVVELPPAVSRRETRKATVADLDGDGRPEVVVMSDRGRPVVLRNTSIEGAVSFVDWTPATSFPSGLDYAGWHAEALDADVDGRLDLVVGGSSRDHLLLQRELPTLVAEDLGGSLPDLFNRDPVRVAGQIADGGEARWLAAGVPARSLLALVAAGCGDLSLSVLDGEGNLVAASDRGGRGAEEAVELRAPGGDLEIVLRSRAGCVEASAGSADYLLEALNRDVSCLAGSLELCLGDGRFRVAVSWKAGERGGAAAAAAVSTEAGYFTFFHRDNVEVVVKILDGRGVNGAFWVFFASLTNVEFTAEVTDTRTARTRRYVNPAGRFASAADVAAFPAESERPPPAADTVPQPIRDGATLRAESAAASNIAPCGGRVGVLCFAGGRFAVSVRWRGPANAERRAFGAPLTGDTAGFWFLSPSRLEFVVKILDARALNGRYWVFFAGLTDRAVTLEVIDNSSGKSRIYTTASGELASHGDTDAFAD